MLITRNKLRRVSAYANDQEASELRSRHAQRWHDSRKIESKSPFSRLGPVVVETELPSSLANTAGTIHDHQVPQLQGLSTASTVQSASVQRYNFSNILRRTRPCYLLVTLGFLVIGGSLAVGLYYSIAKDRMGDGFTTAGWMTAVGTLILAAPMAKHYPHCRCWETRETVTCHNCNAQV